MSDLATSAQKLVGTYGADPVRMMKCTVDVDGVDVAKRLCMVSPINDNMAPFPAYLMSQVEDGVLIVPKEGSTVKVLFSNMNAPTVIQYSSIDKVYIVTGDSSLLVYAAGIELYGNNFGGLVKVLPTTGSFNTIEADINVLKAALAAIILALNTPPVASAPLTGAALSTILGAALNSYNADTLTPTTRASIENTKVQHGNT